MPCTPCGDGRWKWGERGDCRYPSREACQEAHPEPHASADGWRAAHRARVERLEAEATGVILDALSPIMAGIAARFAVASVTAAAGDSAEARASLDDLAAIDLQWRAAVHDQVLPWFAQVYSAGADAAVDQVLGLGIAVLDVEPDLLNAAAADYLAGVENRFYPLGEAAWGAARDQLVEGFREGEGVDALRARIMDVTDLTSRQAEALARTEVIAASNMGAEARVDLMGDQAPPYRQWLSTRDGRTRMTHRVADGQVVARGETFTVGGWPLRVPGDPAGPPSEVVNCRCTVLFTDQAEPLVVAGRQEGGIVDDVADEPLAAAAWRHAAARIVTAGLEDTDENVARLMVASAARYRADEPLAAAAWVEGPPQVDSTTGEPHTGAMIALVPTEADAERLALDGGAERGHEPVEALHLTLAYLGDGDAVPPAAWDAMLAAAEGIAANLPPVTANVFGASLWNPLGEASLVLSVGDDRENDSRPLEAVHGSARAIVAAGQDATGDAWAPPENHSPWVAHVCLSYDPDPAGSFREVAAAASGPITFDRLRLARQAEAFDFPLGASAEEDTDMERMTRDDLVAAIADGFDAALVRAGLGPAAAVEEPEPRTVGDPEPEVEPEEDRIPEGPPAQPGEHLRTVMHRQGQPTGQRGSGRVFTNMTYREPPFAYHVQVDSHAHGGAPRVVQVGLVTRVVQTDDADYGFVRLDLDDPEARDHARRAVAGFDRWVSIGADETNATTTLVWPPPGDDAVAVDPDAEPVEVDPSAEVREVMVQPLRVEIDGAHVAELTAVSMPAQADAFLEPTAELVELLGGTGAAVIDLVASGRLPGASVADHAMAAATRYRLATGGTVRHPERLRAAESGHELILPGDGQSLRQVLNDARAHAGGCGCGGTCGGCGTVDSGPTSGVVSHAHVSGTASATEGDGPGAPLPPALVAAAATITLRDLPPAAWYEEPEEAPAALTITDEGRVYGLVAPFGTGHRAYVAAGRQRRTAPRGRVDYARFMGAWAVTAEGRVPAGALTIGCGHAPEIRHDHATAREHYDNSCSLFATVAVGESDRLGGVWMAGAVLPGVSADTVARALACRCSGDWQSHPDKPGWSEFVAALLVPVPGFARAHAAASYGPDGALVASAVPVVHRATAAEDAARARARAISQLATAAGRTPAVRVLDALGRS